jgi:hypothetical protein
VRRCVNVAITKTVFDSQLELADMDVAYGMSLAVNSFMKREVSIAVSASDSIPPLLTSFKRKPVVRFIHRQQTFCWINMPHNSWTRGILVISSVSLFLLPQMSTEKCTIITAYYPQHTHTRATPNLCSPRGANEPTRRSEAINDSILT